MVAPFRILRSPQIFGCPNPSLRGVPCIPRNLLRVELDWLFRLTDRNKAHNVYFE